MHSTEAKAYRAAVRCLLEAEKAAAALQAAVIAYRTTFSDCAERASNAPPAGLAAQDIDTSDIPEAGEEWFKNAKLRQPRPEKRIAELEMQNRILQQQLDVAKAECARLTALLPPVEKKVDPWANALRWSR